MLCVWRRLLSFCAAFGRVCALKVVDKLAANSLTHELTAAEITEFSRDKD
jgi:hypothetical protein